MNDIFEVANERNRHSNMRLIAARALANPVVQMIAAVGLAGVLFFSIRQVFTPMLRSAQAIEVARVAVWLCSDEASYITGAALPVDGGNSVV